MWVLIDTEAQDLVKKVKFLDKWVRDELKREGDKARLDLVFYAAGLADGIQRVLKKMGVQI